MQERVWMAVSRWKEINLTYLATLSGNHLVLFTSKINLRVSSSSQGRFFDPTPSPPSIVVVTFHSVFVFSPTSFHNFSKVFSSCLNTFLAAPKGTSLGFVLPTCVPSTNTP